MPKKIGQKAGLLPGIHPLMLLSGLARAKRVAEEQKSAAFELRQ
jgi:hypothetical protein